MKGKLLLISAAVTALVSANSFAMEIYKGKLINHKEWSDSNDKFSFKSNVSALPLTLPTHGKKIHGKANGNQAMVYAVANGGNFLTNSDVSLTGYGIIYVENDTDAEQTYDYRQSICVNISEHEQHCAQLADSVDLEPGGYFLNQDMPVVNVTFNEPGNYMESVSSEIRNDLFDTSSSFAITNVQVSDSIKK